MGKQPMLRWSNTDNLPPSEFRGHVQAFTEQELINLFTGAGFSLLENNPINPEVI